MEETDYFAVFPPTWGRVGDISIIFPCSFAVGITQQYGIYVLLGEVICTVRKHSRRNCTVGVQKYICIVNFASGLSRILSKLVCFDKKVFVLMF